MEARFRTDITTGIIHDVIYFKSCSLPENAVSIYPNPAKSVVTILTGENVSSITVMDAEGKLIGNIPVDLYYKQINFSALPNGVYFIKIVTKDKEFNEKVVVMRD